MSNVVTIRRKPRDHHGEMLDRATSLDQPKPRKWSRADDIALEMMLLNALVPFCEREFPELMKVKP